MDEVKLQQGSKASRNELSGTKDHVVLTPVDFRSSFRLFPLKIDEYSFKYMYLFIIIYFIAVLLVDLIFDLRVQVAYPGWNFLLFKHDFTSWILISLAITLALTALFFNRWQNSISPTFQMLLSKERICSLNPDGNIDQEYQRVLTDYQHDLLSKRRYILIGISMVVSLIFVLIREIPVISPSSPDPLLWILAWILGIIKTMLPALLLGYFFGVAAWVMGITGLYIKNLTMKFDLVIQPSHPDHCGGLKILGNFCLGMALPILVAAVFFGVYSVGSTFYPSLLNGLSIVQIAAFVGLIIFTLPLGAITFFVPLWSIHDEMINKKEEYEDEFADHITKLEKRIQSLLDKGALEEAKVAKEEREIMLVLHPDKIGYPTWPFDLRILLTFLTPQIVPIIGLILPLIKH